MFLDYFDVLVSKIILKKIKKYYFNIFLNKRHFIFLDKMLDTFAKFNNKVKKERFVCK